VVCSAVVQPFAAAAPHGRPGAPFAGTQRTVARRGHRKTGPPARIQRHRLFGERKKLCTTSPRPSIPAPATEIGIDDRQDCPNDQFQSWLTDIGMTGWILAVYRMALAEPMPKSSCSGWAR